MMFISTQIRGVVISLIFSALLLPSISFSATLGVINTNDSGPGSLREVVQTLAQDGDEIIFNIPSAPPHNITLTSGQITISNSITITGPGADELIIDGSANERIFQIFSAPSDIDVTISGMTITNGNDSAGGAIRNDESLTILESVLSDSVSETGFGGGAILNNGDMLTIQRSTITGNSSNSGGGILNRSGGTLIMDFVEISGNMSTVNPTSSGGGVNNAGNAIVRDSIISDNFASASGGGINNQGSMTIERSTISGNFTNTAGGGGINNRTTESVVITNTTISTNTTTSGNGGAIRNSRGTIDITNSTIANNDTSLGSAGGIANQGGAIASIINLKSSLVVSNTAPNNPNCSDTGSNSDINDIANNISDDDMDDCAIFFDATFNALTMLGPLQDNGGFVFTHELLGPPNPAINGVPDGECTDQGVPATLITEDARTFPRPGDIGVNLCDIGAFELQPLLTFTVNKTSIPPGSKNFEFFGGSDSIVQGCPLSNTILNDGDSITCQLPIQPFTIQENPTPGFTSTAFCAGNVATIIPLALPEIGAIIIPQPLMFNEIVTCVFTNTGQPTLTVEKQGTGTGTVTSSPVGIDCGGDCSEGFIPDTLVTLTATPDPGSLAGEWGGACAGYIGEEAMVRVDQIGTCTISFEFVDLFDLDIDLAGTGSGNVSAAGIDCGDGGADCMESYNSGTIVNLVATPDGSSVFDGFEGQGCDSGMVVMDQDRTCTAVFDFLPLILNPIFPGVASNPNIIEVEQATANGSVAYIWSFQSGSTTIGGATCSGITLGLKNPQLLGFRQAGADQIAEFIVYIPLNPALENPVLMQAIDIATCRTSEVVSNIILNE